MAAVWVRNFRTVVEKGSMTPCQRKSLPGRALKIDFVAQRVLKNFGATCTPGAGYAWPGVLNLKHAQNLRLSKIMPR
jgi:hypothetical protein